MKPKKVPTRMCIGCKTMKQKKELIRIVRDAQNGVAHIDKTLKANGRGAYLCKSSPCLEKAIKIRALERALEVKIEQEVFTLLREELQELDNIDE